MPPGYDTTSGYGRVNAAFSRQSGGRFRVSPSHPLKRGGESVKVETNVKAGDDTDPYEPYDPNQPLEARLWKPGQP